jgi:hypothetical protein
LADALGCLLNLIVRQVPQELDGVEDVGLADAIRSEEARQRAETNVDIAQVLEALNLEPEQHA